MAARDLQKRAEAALGTVEDPAVRQLLEDLLRETARLDGRLGKVSRISDRYQAELRDLNQELGRALAEVKTLQGFIPICAKCKRIRDDHGFWEQVESYLVRHSSAVFSHGVCPECALELFPHARGCSHGQVEPSPLEARPSGPRETEELEAYLRSLCERPSSPMLDELSAAVRAQLVLMRRFTKIVRISDGYQAELKKLNAALAEASRTDVLTGLLNRRGMSASLNAELARSARTQAPLSALLLDLDQFKAINDTYGHELGDCVLERVASLLKSSLRDYDAVARWGGEEFLVLLPGTGLEAAWSVAEKLRSLVEGMPVERDGLNLSVTLCVGVAQWRTGESLASLLRRADDACYAAKRQGRNRTVMAP